MKNLEKLEQVLGIDFDHQSEGKEKMSQKRYVNKN